MYVKRDYSRSFFGVRKRRSYRPVFYMLLFGAGALVFVYLNLESLRATAIELVGMAPTPTPLPAALAARAETLAAAGNLGAAAALFAEVIRQRPDDIGYLYEYGKLLIDLGDYEAAIDLGDRAVELDLMDPRGYALRATALVFSGNPSEALTTALNGIDANRSFAPLYSALARAYADIGRYQDGLDAGFRAVELDPFDVDARRAYAYALNWAGLPLDATAQLEQAVALNPNRMPAYFELAFQYLAQDRDDEAIDIYNRILSLQPRNARAMLRLCLAYRKVGQFERAMGYCQDAVDADPNSAEAWFELGRMRYNNFDFAGALEAFTACLTHDPASLECAYRAGLAHFYLGDCDTAWTMLRESLQAARSRTGVDQAVATITEGLVAIEQQCPQYSGLIAPLVSDPQPTPGG